MSLETRETTFLAVYPGILPGYPEVPEKFEKKNCVQFSFLRFIYEGNFVRLAKVLSWMRHSEGIPFEPVLTLEHATRRSKCANVYKNEMASTDRDLNCSGASPTCSSFVRGRFWRMCPCSVLFCILVPVLVSGNTGFVPSLWFLYPGSGLCGPGASAKTTLLEATLLRTPEM